LKGDRHVVSQEEEMGRVANKVALVTGAAQGQGRSHALALAEEGADVIGIDLGRRLEGLPYDTGSQDGLKETGELVRALGQRAEMVAADVRDLPALRSAIGSAVQSLGGLHTVVANAGVGTSPYDADKLPEEEWDRNIGINLTGVWKTCAAAIPHVVESRAGGSIIIISSVAGARGRPRLGHYVAAKHGVIGLMRSLALELGDSNIRVNAILPGTVNTQMLVNDEMLEMFRGDEAGEGGSAEDELARVAQSQNVLPMPWAEPRDISNAVLFLASDESRCITGVSLPVDVGRSL
jgi:SDR family mycofactocin-dependent oxidoreductase